MTEALQGIKVLDLCRSYPPAFAGMFMADFGAEVIRIDPPGFVFPVPTKGGAEAWAAYYCLDRNKKSLTLNLKSKKALDVFFKLIKESDVLIENSRPGTMDKIGIGYSAVSKVNPKLVYCSVSGYGQTGPYKDLPGHDSNYLGVAGMLSIIGEKGGPPVAPSNIVGDMAGAGMHTLAAVLIALLARERTGKGQFLDVSYTDSVFSLFGFEIAMYYLTGIEPKRGMIFRTGSEALVNSYECKDGEWFNIACVEEKLWVNLCKAMGCEQFIPYQWPGDNEAKRQEMLTWFRKKFKEKTRAEWWEWAKDKDIAAGPVWNLPEALKDPQMVQRQMVMKVKHPKFDEVTQAGFPLKLHDTPAKFKKFGPMPGEHTDEILKSLGYKAAEIKALQDEGVV